MPVPMARRPHIELLIVRRCPHREIRIARVPREEVEAEKFALPGHDALLLDRAVAGGERARGDAEVADERDQVDAHARLHRPGGRAQAVGSGRLPYKLYHYGG